MVNIKHISPCLVHSRTTLTVHCLSVKLCDWAWSEFMPSVSWCYWDPLAPVSTNPGMGIVTLTKPGPPGALQTAVQKAKTKARESEQRVLRAEVREEVISWLTEKGIWEGEGRGLEGPIGKVKTKGRSKGKGWFKTKT